MMEYFDIYDCYRRKKNILHKRGELIKDGNYHIVIHLWIINSEGKFLIQRRQPWKKGWPNMWDCAAAGAAQAGDNSISAVIRETAEEIGFSFNEKELEPLFSVKFSVGFDDIWLLKKNINLQELHLQEEEVAEVKWASREEIIKMMKDGLFINYDYLYELFRILDTNVSLFKAGKDDGPELYEIQKRAFMTLYKKYEDHETSPVVQSYEAFIRRFSKGDYYKIFYKEELVGSVFVYKIKPDTMRLHIINILEEYQGKGIGQEVIKRLEGIYVEVDKWELDTILEEKRNCHVYERAGYEKTKDVEKINDKLTLIKYIKKNGLNKVTNDYNK